MKTKIYYKRFRNEHQEFNVDKLEINPEGDWIDVCSAINISLKGPQSCREHTVNGIKRRDVTLEQKLIPLGIAIKLPKGYEAMLINRSGTGRKKNAVLVNGLGLIDGSFSGNGDQWHYPCIAVGDVDIKKNEAICQFRIQLSQHATVMDKLKWLFSDGIELIEIPSLPNKKNRGGGCIRAEKEYNK